MFPRLAMEKRVNLYESQADEAESLASMVRTFVRDHQHWRDNELCNDFLNVLTDAASDCEAEAQKHREKVL